MIQTQRDSGEARLLHLPQDPVSPGPFTPHSPSWVHTHGLCTRLTAHTIMHACVLSHSVLSKSATPRNVAHQAPLFMGFSKQEYWSGLPCSFPGNLPDPGIKPLSLKSPASAGRFFTTSTTWEALSHCVSYNKSHDLCVRTLTVEL